MATNNENAKLPFGAGQPSVMEQLENLLKDAIDKDEIPGADGVINAIKSGEVSLDDVKASWAKRKGGAPTVTVNRDTGEVNAVKDVAQTAFGAAAQADKPIAEPKDMAAPQTGIEGILESSPKLKSINDAITDSYKVDVKEISYTSKKFLSGLSFDIYDPDIEAPSDGSEIMGTIAYGAGMILGGYLGGAALRAIGVVGKLASSAYKATKAVALAKEYGHAVSFGTKAAAYGKEAASIAAEAGVLGFGTGTAKGLVEGDSVTDSIERGIVDAGMFMAGGELLHGGASAVMKGLQKGANAWLPYVRRAKAIRGKATAELAKDPDYVLKSIEAIPEAERSEAMTMTRNALIKARANKENIDFHFDPDTIAATYKNREADLEKLANDLFTSEGAPLKKLYEKTPALQQLMENGNYKEAVVVGQTYFRSEMKNNKTVGEMLASDFMIDSKVVYNAMADKLAGKVDPKINPVTARTLIANYMEEVVTGQGSANKLEELKNVVVGADKKARQRFGNMIKTQEKFLDTRITSNEADTIVGNILDNHLKILAGKSKSAFGSTRQIAEILDSQSMLRSAIKGNKNLFSSFAQAAHTAQDYQDFFRNNEKGFMGFRDYQKIRNQGIQISYELNAKRELQRQYAQNKDPLIKKQIKSLSASLVGRYKALQTSQAAFNSLDPDLQKSVIEYANSIYSPTKQQLNVSDVELTKRFASKVDAVNATRESNPVLLAKESDLVDELNMLTTTGLDIGDSFKRKTVRRTIFNFDTILKFVRREFGYGSAMESMLQGIKQTEVKRNQYITSKIDMLKGYGKEGDEVSKLMHRFIRGDLKQTDTAFNELPVATQKKLLEGKPAYQQVYKEIWEDINAANRRNNLPEIAWKDDYITQVHEAGSIMAQYKRALDFTQNPDEIAKLLSGEAVEKNGKVEIPILFPENKGLNFFYSKSASDPTRTVLNWERRRTDAPGFIEDAVTSMKAYLPSAADRIFYSDHIRQLEAMQGFATGSNMLDFIKHIKNDVLLKVPDAYKEAFGDVKMNKLLKFVQKHTAEGSLLFNINTIANQATSTAFNAFYGGRPAASAIVNRFSDESQGYIKGSRNLAARADSGAMGFTDMDSRLFPEIIDAANKIPGAKGAKAAKDYFRKFGSWALSMADREATIATGLTAVAHAKQRGFTDAKTLQKVFDNAADIFQASISSVDRPYVLDTVFGRAVFQFQSFTMNLANTIMTDLPMLAKSEGVGAAVKGILRTAAACSVTNSIAEELGMPQPFNLQTFIPGFSTFKYGAPGFLGIVKSAVEATDKSPKSIAKTALKTGLIQALPGGLQVYKFGEAMLSDDIKGSQKIKGALFGASTQRRYAKDNKKMKPKQSPAAKKKPTESWLKQSFNPKKGFGR